MSASKSTTIQLRSKGSITLPVDLRRKYGLSEGDVLTLVDLGEGVFMLAPQITQVDRLGDRVAQALAEAEVSLEEMLALLDEERRAYYGEHYAET